MQQHLQPATNDVSRLTSRLAGSLMNQFSVVGVCMQATLHWQTGHCHVASSCIRAMMWVTDSFHHAAPAALAKSNPIITIGGCSER